jgi:hypothetical protein
MYCAGETPLFGLVLLFQAPNIDASHLQTPAGLQLGRWREWEFAGGPIPRRLWQTYSSQKPPQEGMEAYWSWHELNPGLQTIIHDDAQAHECIKHLYGDEVSRIYAAFPLNVMRSDFWRYAILYAFGGIYADIDVQALRPLNMWLPPEPDGVHWPPNNDTRIAPTWSDCRLIVGLENLAEHDFCQWVRAMCPLEPLLLSCCSCTSTPCALRAGFCKLSRPPCVEGNN